MKKLILIILIISSYVIIKGCDGCYGGLISDNPCADLIWPTIPIKVFVSDEMQREAISKINSNFDRDLFIAVDEDEKNAKGGIFIEVTSDKKYFNSSRVEADTSITCNTYKTPWELIRSNIFIR